MIPTTTDISDLIETITNFVLDNPEWHTNNRMVDRLGVAYQILTNISTIDMVTDEEYEFIMDIHETIKARNTQ
jgi:hypothetical protein